MNTAADQLNNLPGLLPRMTALMDIEIGGKDTDQLVEEVLNEMWRSVYLPPPNRISLPASEGYQGPSLYMLSSPAICIMFKRGNYQISAVFITGCGQNSPMGSHEMGVMMKIYVRR